MNKREYFLEALRNNCYKNSDWVFSAFALSEEAPDAWKEKPYPFRVVRTLTNYSYVNPNNTEELLPIEESDPSLPLINYKEGVHLDVGDTINVVEAVDTTYGNVLANYLLVIYPFGKKVSFIVGRFNPTTVENLILPMMADEPDNPEDKKDNLIYPSEYLNLSESVAYASAHFSQLYSPAATRKTMTTSPEMQKLKEILVERYKDQINDPVVLSKIEAELIQLDRDWLKGDDGENFYIKAKSFKTVRKKLFAMYGGEPGLEDKIEVDTIVKSLTEGLDIDRFPAMMNALRAGSFNRGAQTEKGGQAVKDLLRATATINITKEDCGSRLGVLTEITLANKKTLIGRSIVSQEGHIELTKDNIEQYFGQKVMVRSPMFCKAHQPDYCPTCVGKNLADNPTAASVAISGVGDAILAMFMSAAHSKGISTKRMNLKKVLI